MEQKIKTIIFGATGMVGQGVLQECLRSDHVASVLLVSRSALGLKHPKVKEILHHDFFDFSAIESQLKGYNACFFCLGVSSAGMKEETYAQLTYSLTTAAAKVLLINNRDMTFIYVSGTGTDSTEKGRTMWARVKGKTENALLAMPFKQSYMFRPGYIQPLDGIRSKTRLYNIMYTIFKPLYPVFKSLFPNRLTTTQKVGLAMIQAVRCGYPKNILESADINALAAQ